MEINKIYCESNLETMARMPDGFVDYTLTSPPYNIKNERIAKYEDFSDDFNELEYYNQQVELITNLLRVTKKHIFYNIQMVSGNKLALHKLMGYFADKIKEVIIWQKVGQPAISEKVFNSAFEYILVFSNDSPEKRYFSDAKFKRWTQSNIFKIKNTHNNPYSDVHKAIMPLDIPRYFMGHFGESNDLWYDPYMGTGTTAVAALKESRQYVGSEISTKYLEISERRINEFSSQITLF